MSSQQAPILDTGWQGFSLDGLLPDPRRMTAKRDVAIWWVGYQEQHDRTPWRQITASYERPRIRPPLANSATGSLQ
jgi:hypothetical protein